jgi:hypothetical protein
MVRLVKAGRELSYFSDEFKKKSREREREGKVLK